NGAMVNQAEFFICTDRPGGGAFKDADIGDVEEDGEFFLRVAVSEQRLHVRGMHRQSAIGKTDAKPLHPGDEANDEIILLVELADVKFRHQVMNVQDDFGSEELRYQR